MPEPAIIETTTGEWLKVKADRDMTWIEVYNVEDEWIAAIQLDAQGIMKLAAAAHAEVYRIRDLTQKPRM